MAIELNRPEAKFHVRYTDVNHNQHTTIVKAVGVTGAKDQFAVDFPGCTIVSIYQGR